MSKLSHRQAQSGKTALTEGLRFGGTEQQNFLDTLNWLHAADRSKLLCANERYYLLHPSSSVTWRAEKCTTFINAIVSYWNKA